MRRAHASRLQVSFKARACGRRARRNLSGNVSHLSGDDARRGTPLRRLVETASRQSSNQLCSVMSASQPFRCVAFEYTTEDAADTAASTAAADHVERGHKRSAAAAAATTAHDDDHPAERGATNKKEKRQKVKHDVAAALGGAAVAAAAGPLDQLDCTCPTCLEAYECADEAERLPRALPCSHNCCSACLLVLLKSTPGSVTHTHAQQQQVAQRRSQR